MDPKFNKTKKDFSKTLIKISDKSGWRFISPSWKNTKVAHFLFAIKIVAE